MVLKNRNTEMGVLCSENNGIIIAIEQRRPFFARFLDTHGGFDLSETTYHLYALCQGSRACDASWLLYLSESGRTRTLPYFFWILHARRRRRAHRHRHGLQRGVPEGAKSRLCGLPPTAGASGAFRHQTLGCRDADREPSALGSLHVAETLHRERAFISKGASSISGGATRRNTTSSTIFWAIWPKPNASMRPAV